MLEEVRISGLGVIDDAVLELHPGLNVVTGETGAGKTMVVTGLGLLLGARADTALVRTGAAAAVVEGVVAGAADHPAAARASEAGADIDDGLILVRTVSAEGRSRAHNLVRRGVLGVEMEASALFRVGAYRGARVASLLVVSDELAGRTWRPGFDDPAFRTGTRQGLKIVVDVMSGAIP